MLLACAGLLVVSCADGSGEASSAANTAGSDGATFAAGAGSESALPILTQMQGVLDVTAFRGVRRVIERQGGLSLEQLEDVGADGQGRFSIELIDTISLPPDVDELSYPLLFESSARFQWTMRDFQVRDAAMAAQNYLVQTLPETPLVAGIGCVRLSVFRSESIGDRPGHYRVDVDPNTGFVLAWSELDDSGAELARVQYESFEYGGDLSDMILRGRSFEASPLTLTLPLHGQVDFTPRFPELLPGGMQVVSAEVQTVPASLADAVTPGESSYLPVGDWLRMIATDGIEAISFAHSSNVDTSAEAALGELRMVERGAWEIGFGRLDGTVFVVAARATLAEIERIVSSAF
ncbi:MAG: hypothetical protein AAGG01_08820 [Planctomycetota bacterium]